ncbi:MAG: hypothetical protein JNM43_11190 [Planctomycetaceae bacterium]|nr:hypothetical protein [Planctomycetaceae bacterium]
MLGEHVNYVWQSLGPTVYEGTAGISDFLAELFVLSGERLHRNTALAAMQHALEHSREPGDRFAAGVFSGTLGIGYAAIHVGLRLGAQELVDNGHIAMKRGATVFHPKQEIDVIGGSAGAIPLLIEIGRKFDSLEYLDLATQHGELLLNRSTRRLIKGTTGSNANSYERYWSNPSFGRDGLTGYSHGNSGFAIALLELFHLTSDEKYRVAARESLEFERRWFDSTRQNWCDLRVAAGTPPVSCSWCHGAPGIGLARVRMQELLSDDPSIEAEIQIACSTTLRSLEDHSAVGRNFSLCHGQMGNAATLMAVKSAEMRAAGEETVKQMLTFALNQHANSHLPWICGTQDGRMTPGLMLGTAGIGSALLSHFHANSDGTGMKWLMLRSDQ